MRKPSISGLLALTVILLAGCKKNDDPGTNPAEPVYLPVSVYYQINNGSNVERVGVDSFVYNADNTPATLFIDQLQNQQWRQRLKFGYNDREQCTSISWYRGNDIEELDSLIYTTNKVSVYKLDPISHSLRDSTFIRFNTDNQVVLVGSKDTTRQFDAKLLRYTELTYNDGNPVKVLDHRYETIFGDDGTTTTEELSYTYDRNPNPFKEVFSRNPYIIQIIHQSEPMFSLGKNSITSVTTKSNDGSTSTVNFSHQLDANGNLSITEVSVVGGEKFTAGYSYMKSK